MLAGGKCVCFFFKDISKFSFNFQYQKQKLHLKVINQFSVSFSHLSPLPIPPQKREKKVFLECIVLKEGIGE